MKIGELAKKSNVSVKALRLYHDMHLLEPESVDESGHRIYSERSFRELTKIQSLKKLGFSLLEIQGFLNRKAPTIAESIQFQKNKTKEEIEKKEYELHRIEVAEGIINESADVEKMMETVTKLSRAEEYLSLKEIKQIESINRNNSEIQELIDDKKNWYEGMQEAFKKNVPADDPKVQIMASKWNRYASYWREKQADIAQKIKKMEQKASPEQLGVLATPEFQVYVKRAIDILKN